MALAPLTFPAPAACTLHYAPGSDFLQTAAAAAAKYSGGAGRLCLSTFLLAHLGAVPPHVFRVQLRTRGQEEEGGARARSITAG